MSVLRILFSVMLLKRGPEEMPGSPRLLQQIIILNALSGIIILSTRFELTVAVASAFLDLALILGFSYVLLLALAQRIRFVQTASALCGVGIIFHLLSWPMLLVAGSDIDSAGETGRAMVSLLMLLLISWELLVVSHIFQRAIESSKSSAIALSFALFIISITVSQLLFQDIR